MKFDLAVIGGGPAGYTAALTAAKFNLKTVLIEPRQLGGTCLNRGCIPTKALLYCAECYTIAKNSAKFGVKAEVQPFDYNAACKHRDQTVKRLRSGVEFLIKQSGGTFINGTAVLRDQSSLTVGNDLIEFTDLIIATGASPAIPPFKTDEQANVINSDQFLALENIPESCVIVGAGVIGMEFATFLTRIGRKVTVLEAQNRVLPTMDQDLADLIRKRLETEGVRFFTNTFVQKCVKSDNRTLCDILRNDALESLETDLVIVATGRIANTLELHCERAQIKLQKSFIEVDDCCATATPHLYAVGDVNGRKMLAHAASFQARRTVENIALGKKTPILTEPVPACVYTDPELASVGLTKDEAKALNIPFVLGRADAIANGKLLAMGRKFGYVEIITHSNTGEIIGAHIAAPHASDLIAEMTLAIKQKIKIREFATVIHPHPAISELIADAIGQIRYYNFTEDSTNEVFSSFDGKCST